MKVLVEAYLKSLGMKTIIRKKISNGDITCVLYDFLDKEDRFCSFLVAYNLTQIIIKEKEHIIRIGQGLDNSTQRQLEAGLRVFNSKDAYLAGRWEESYVTRFPAMLAQVVANMSSKFEVIEKGAYRIVGIVPEFRSFIGVFIYYLFDNAVQPPLLYHLGCENVLAINTPNSEDLCKLLHEMGCKEIRI